MGRRPSHAGLTAIIALVLAFLLIGVSASAAPVRPVLSVTHEAQPTTLAPGETGTYRVLVENVGPVATAGEVSIAAQLPSGVTASGVGQWAGVESDGYWSCPGVVGASVANCTVLIGDQQTYGPDIPHHATAPPLTLLVDVDSAAVGPLQSAVSVSGGGAEPASSMLTTTLGTQSPGFGIAGFFGRALAVDGTAARQAGSHPDFTTRIDFNTERGSAGPRIPSAARDIHVELPPGLVGDPTALPACPAVDFANFGGPKCPPETQVGTVDLTAARGTIDLGTNIEEPVYNVAPGKGSPARFGFNIVGVVVNLEPRVRAGGDYGITADVERISETLAITSSKITLWGVPADPIHDRLRIDPVTTLPGAKSSSPRRPFWTAPTRCDGEPLVTKMSAASWDAPDVFDSASFDSDVDGVPFVVEGCEGLSFEPELELRPETGARRGAPAGIGVTLRIPQSANPDGLAPSQLRKAVVVLPEGMTVNPSSASGLEGCAPSQIKIDSEESPACPNASKLGSVAIDTPLLEKPLQGSIYLASQRDNPFGTTLAIYLVAEGSGVTIKLPGRIDSDGRQVRATFDDNPQLPFEELSLQFKTGPRAALSLPTECGPATTTAVLTPWSGNDPVTVESTFAVSADGRGAPCSPFGFAPSFTAGVANPVAGAQSPLSIVVARGDEEQELKAVERVELPEGLLAKVGSVPLCGDLDAARGSCAASSRLGHVQVAAGRGELPIWVPQQGKAPTGVYLTGPYKGAPYGLSIVVPAQAGPFDLGTVVVRSALRVDPTDASVTAETDDIPQVLEGIPLRTREIRVIVDRPGFMLNPTGCGEKRIDARLVSTGGAVHSPRVPFQVGDCARLGFAPKLAMRLSGRRQTRTGGHPALQAVLRQRTGQSAIDRAKVTLPPSVVLDPDNAQALCEFEDGIKADLDERCPKGSIVGRASAVTPVLKRPLSGSVYFVKNVERNAKTGALISKLPMVVVALRGEVSINLVGKSSTTRSGRLVATFGSVPDAPVSKFALRIDGGADGILVVTRTRRSKIDLCASKQVAGVKTVGHSRKRADFATTVRTPCSKTAKAEAGKREKR